MKIWRLSKSRRPLQAKISHHCGWLVSSASGLLCATKLTAYDARICKNGFVKIWRRLRSPVLSPLCRSGSAAFDRQRTVAINDAKEESQSAATKYADRSRPIIRQSSREPNDTALPGNEKPVAVPAACPRTSLTADRRADLLLGFGT